MARSVDTNRIFLLLALAVTLVLRVDPSALAQGPYVTLDDPAPAVEEVDGGGYKLSVGLTNITNQAVEVKLDATSPRLTPACAVMIGDGDVASIPSALHSDVAVSFDNACEETDVDSLVLGAGPDAAQKVTLKPKDPTKATPDWDLLWAFPIALGAAAFGMAALALVWNVGPGRELANLPDTWKFSDSLVTNVTLVGGTLVGVVGSSEVVKAFLGQEADASIALITVGAAVAAATIGLGAVVLQALRKADHFTVGGLLVAAAMILGGAFGELYVVLRNGQELTLGGWENDLDVVVALLALLLLFYTYRSLKETIEQGLATPKPKRFEMSADHLAAAAIGSALHDGITPSGLAQEIRDVFAEENERLVAQAEMARHEATPNSRIKQLQLTPNPAIGGKSALL